MGSEMCIRDSPSLSAHCPHGNVSLQALRWAKKAQWLGNSCPHFSQVLGFGVVSQTTGSMARRGWEGFNLDCENGSMRVNANQLPRSKQLPKLSVKATTTKHCQSNYPSYQALTKQLPNAATAELRLL